MNNKNQTPGMQISQIAHFHKDGLIDIFAGLSIALYGAAIFADMIWMGGVSVAIFLPLWISSRQSITFRRVSHLEATNAQKARIQQLLSMSMLLLGVFALAGVFALRSFEYLNGPNGAWLRENFLLILGAIFAIFWVATGLVLSQPRMHFYGLLTLLAMAAGRFEWIEFPWALLILGGLVTLGGGLTLIRFLQAYPLPEKGA